MASNEEHPQAAKANRVSADSAGRNGDESFCGFDSDQTLTPEPVTVESGRLQEQSPADALNLLRDLCYQRSLDDATREDHKREVRALKGGKTF